MLFYCTVSRHFYECIHRQYVKYNVKILNHGQFYTLDATLSPTFPSKEGNTSSLCQNFTPCTDFLVTPLFQCSITTVVVAVLLCK